MFKANLECQVLDKLLDKRYRNRKNHSLGEISLAYFLL